jgi:hypothetical protein
VKEKKEETKEGKRAGCLSSLLHDRLTSGGSWFQGCLGKKFQRAHLNGQKMGILVCACHPSDVGN